MVESAQPRSCKFWIFLLEPWGVNGVMRFLVLEERMLTDGRQQFIPPLTPITIMRQLGANIRMKDSGDVLEVAERSTRRSWSESDLDMCTTSWTSFREKLEHNISDDKDIWSGVVEGSKWIDVSACHLSIAVTPLVMRTGKGRETGTGYSKPFAQPKRRPRDVSWIHPPSGTW